MTMREKTLDIHYTGYLNLTENNIVIPVWLIQSWKQSNNLAMCQTFFPGLERQTECYVQLSDPAAGGGFKLTVGTREHSVYPSVSLQDRISPKMLHYYFKIDTIRGSLITFCLSDTLYI